MQAMPCASPTRRSNLVLRLESNLPQVLTGSVGLETRPDLPALKRAFSNPVAFGNDAVRIWLRCNLRDSLSTRILAWRSRKRDAILKRVCAQLAALTAVHRRSAIKLYFSQAQRTALETYLLSRRSSEIFRRPGIRERCYTTKPKSVNQFHESCRGGGKRNRQPMSKAFGKARQTLVRRGAVRPTTRCSSPESPTSSNDQPGMQTTNPESSCSFENQPSTRSSSPDPPSSSGLAGMQSSNLESLSSLEARPSTRFSNPKSTSSVDNPPNLCVRPRRIGLESDSQSLGDSRGVLSHVSSQTGCRYYHALIAFEMVRLTSRKSRNADDVILYRRVLESIRTYVVTRFGSLEDRLKEAVIEVPKWFGLDARQMGLRLAVSVSAHRWIGAALRTPTFSVSDVPGLAKALEALRRLRAANDALCAAQHSNCADDSCKRLEITAWGSLRETLLDVEADAGFNRRQRELRILQAEQKCGAQRKQNTLRKRERQEARKTVSAITHLRRLKTELVSLRNFMQL